MFERHVLMTGVEHSNLKASPKECFNGTGAMNFFYATL